MIYIVKATHKKNRRVMYLLNREKQMTEIKHNSTYFKYKWYAKYMCFKNNMIQAFCKKFNKKSYICEYGKFTVLSIKGE